MIRRTAKIGGLGSSKKWREATAGKDRYPRAREASAETNAEGGIRWPAPKTVNMANAVGELVV